MLKFEGIKEFDIEKLDNKSESYKTKTSKSKISRAFQKFSDNFFR